MLEILWSGKDSNKMKKLYKNKIWSLNTKIEMLLIKRYVTVSEIYDNYDSNHNTIPHTTCSFDS